MARPSVALAARIHEIIDNAEPLPPEADSPIGHYRHTAGELWNLVDFFDRGLGRSPAQTASRGRHLGRFNGMDLVSLIENFERFLKEIAAVCVDQVVNRVVDDRFGKGFPLHASSLVAHFQAGTLGRSICESLTWLDC